MSTTSEFPLEKDECFTLLHTSFATSSLHGGASGAGCEWQERLLWDLHSRFPPTGSVALADDLLSKRISFVDKSVNAVKFAKQLFSEHAITLESTSQRDTWDDYYLANCYRYGRGVSQSHALAADYFEKSAKTGNPFASFEAIWSKHLAGGTRTAAIASFRRCEGLLQEFARRSADALALLEAGPVREIGSPAHLFRIVELFRLLNRFLYHDQASRQLRIEILKEIRIDVPQLESSSTPLANLILYVLATRVGSLSITTPPAELFHSSVQPGNTGLLTLLDLDILDETEIQQILEISEQEGWQDLNLSQMAMERLVPRLD